MKTIIIDGVEYAPVMKEEPNLYGFEEKITKSGSCFFIKGDKKEIEVWKDEVSLKNRIEVDTEKQPRFIETTASELKEGDVFGRESGEAYFVYGENEQGEISVGYIGELFGVEKILGCSFDKDIIVFKAI